MSLIRHNQITAFLRQISSTGTAFIEHAGGNEVVVDGVIDIAAALAAAFSANPAPQADVTGWQPMETAPLDGTHCILAIQSGGGFVYSIQGAYMQREWHNAADIKAEPLAWMPNILLPDEYCPWTEAFKARALAATEGSAYV